MKTIKRVTAIIASMLILSGCTMRNSTDKILLADGHEICTWGQANIGMPSLAGAQSCNKKLVVNYQTHQEDLLTVSVREGIRAGFNVWAADIISSGLSQSGDQVYNSASGGNSSNWNVNTNVNQNLNVNQNRYKDRR